MAIISVKSLIEAGVHFGHRISRWNPKMAPYIFGKRNLIHIINLRETVRGLIRAYHFLNKLSAEGHEVLFVGTKRQAKAVIRREAARCGMHYVAERWLGGSLTNYTTIRKRLSRLEELDRMEQDGTMAGFSKKQASSLRRERKKIFRNLEGIRIMEKLPGALIIIDPQKEHIAVREAAKLNIPTICLMDTDSDPDMVDIPIPGNDDAMRSIEVICTKLTDAILEGKALWEENQRIEARKRAEDSSKNKPEGESRRYSDSSKNIERKSEHKGPRQDDRSGKPGKKPIQKHTFRAKYKRVEGGSEPKKEDENRIEAKSGDTAPEPNVSTAPPQVNTDKVTE